MSPGENFANGAIPQNVDGVSDAQALVERIPVAKESVVKMREEMLCAGVFWGREKVKTEVLVGVGVRFTGVVALCVWRKELWEEVR